MILLQKRLCPNWKGELQLSRKDGQYSDGSECAAYICKSCFSRDNDEKIMRTIWKGYKYAKKIRKQRGEE